MSSLFSDLHPLAVLPALINHLLKSEAWARTVLQAHAGKAMLLTMKPLTLRLVVDAQGYVGRAAADVQTSLRVDMPLTSLPQVLAGAGGSTGARMMRYVRIEGDADFAQSVSSVAANLRWDVEEDLSRVVGDVAATQIVAGVGALRREVGSARRKLADNVAEYLLEENPQLVRPRSIDALGDSLRILRDDLARLEQRIERIESIQRPEGR